MTASERLDDIQTRYVEWHQDRGDHTPAPDDWLDADPGESMEHCIVRNDVPVMHAALRAVLDLHSEIWHDGPRCNECSEPELDESAEWPCPTVRAVEAALGEVAS